jgi:formylglycine-generating enzyme required for sulfatase activity
MNSPLSDTLTQELAQQQVERFVARFERNYRYLACHCALPLVLTPELVNYIRVQFLLNEEVPWIAEADLLLSELCRPVGYELYAMSPAVRSNLLAQFQEPEFQQKFGSHRLKSVAQLLMDYVTYLMRTHPTSRQAELQAQRWAAMVYLDEHRTKAEEEIATALQALVNRGKNGQAELARLQRLIEEFRPQLSQYQSLIEFSKLLGNWLKDSSQIQPELIQTYSVHGVKLNLPTPGRNWAIAIGINQYQNFNPNQYAVRDAEAMKDWFRQSGFSEVHSLSEANYGTFQSFFRSHFQNASLTPNDTLWFYFSGLGVTSGDRDYLLFSDSNLDDLENTAISVGALSQRLLESGVGRLILLLDADRWGRWQYGKQRETLPPASALAQALIRQSGIDPKKQGLLVFYACLPDQGAYEIDQFQHGLFTYAFREAVQHWRGENVSAEMLYQSLRDLAVRLATQHIRAPQTPELVAEPESLREQLLLLAPTFSFETVTVNRRGEITKRETKTARYYTEDLGNGITLDLVAIPGGKFLMGSPPGEKDSSDDERPQHEVTVPPFFMGKYPVTQAQWRAIASRMDLKVERDLDLNPAYFKDRSDSDLRPVEQVSWYDAVEFCARLSKLTGKEYRLTSEAEWEYACRAGTTTPFYFGETITSDLANYSREYTYADKPKGLYRKETTPVGQFPPNAFGLYDLHGQVWEWCADDWHENYKGAPSDGSAWLDKNDNRSQKKREKRSPLRGGSWNNNPNNCRSAYRNNINNNIGFRVVCGGGSTVRCESWCMGMYREGNRTAQTCSCDAGNGIRKLIESGSLVGIMPNSSSAHRKRERLRDRSQIVVRRTVVGEKSQQRTDRLNSTLKSAY